MKCYKPINIKYRDKQTGLIKSILVRCNKCLACKEEIAREYTYRFINESVFYKYIYFATLTYDDEHIPIKNFEYEKDGIKYEGMTYTLDKEQIVKYIKQVNINIRRHFPKEKYAYFLTGEYGEETNRPHYHISILCNNQDVAKVFYAKWFSGNVDFQKATIKSCFYTIGYSDKKVGIDEWKYNNREKPFRKFSRGLGKAYYERYKDILAEQYSGKIGNSRIPLPVYYKNKLKEAELVDINELTEKAMKNNEEIVKYMEVIHKKDIITQGEFDFMKLMKDRLKQRERNYKAKYERKKARRKV